MRQSFAGTPVLATAQRMELLDKVSDHPANPIPTLTDDTDSVAGQPPLFGDFSMTRQFVLCFFVLVALAFGTSVAQAQSAPKTEKVMLVLDESGSMWGQINGEAKITIARRVISDLLDTLPESIELGLTAYGHREKGNCDDIETLVVPGAQPRSAIRQAIAVIKPKGKTPLSKAVVMAAEALKYEEDKATVILISDGIETCNYDPCAVGKSLEANGIDFTTHVIGFDIADDETRAQLQCLAENTGGRFLTADSAEELADALEQVSKAPPPLAVPAKIDAVFAATDGEGGPVIKSGLTWTLTDLKTGAAVVDGLAIGVLRMPVEAGAYMAVVTREDDVSAELEAEIGPNGDYSFVLPLIAELPDASISAAAEAPQGSTLPVTWTGPDEDRDFISVAETGSKGGAYINYTYTEDGSPLQLQMPPEPGTYEIRYISKGSTILASATVTVVPVDVSVSAVSEAAQGSTIPVSWVGPDEPRDYISVAETGSNGGAYINYTYTEDGNPAQLQMPPEPGTYEIRYILNQDNEILASTPITVTAVEVSVSAASEAPLGSTIPVTWTGPNESRDYISVAETGSSGGAYINYTYTEDGSPAQLQMPPEPGTYEIRYILNQDNKILASTPVTITAVEASVSAVGSAPAGSEITVTWTGPDEPRDYISVAETGSSGGAYIKYTYTEDGSPLKLTLPDAPGNYEIRYILSQDNTVLARQPITVN